MGRDLPHQSSGSWPKVVTWQDGTVLLNKGHLALGVHIMTVLGDSEMLILTQELSFRK